MAEPRPRRQIPRFLMVVVPLLTLGIALVAVAFAWRSSDHDEPVSTPEPLPSIQAASEAFLGCTDCHEDLDKVFDEGLVTNLRYTHEEHFSKGVSECAVCHPANTHEPDKINTPTMSRCFICHGLGESAIAPGSCETCHPPGMRQEPRSHLANDWVVLGHSEAALEDQFECLTCHEQATCDSCHGLEMPHEESFEEETHPLAYFEDPQVCLGCHPQPAERRDECDTCHHPQGPKDTPWVRFHPTAVTELGAGTCFQCHSDQTCRTCHSRGVEDMAADEAVLLSSPSVTPDG
ncbi:MAG TPA: hypothetical protein VE669_00670 [Actinomycetota bacterium]|jgi:hypothetical protein|nr:hypothetical protein [Actinomycetota bacterium]